MRVFLLIFFLHCYLFSTDNNQTFYIPYESSFEQNTSKGSIETNLTKKATKDQQNILISYKYIPKDVFVGEIFKIEFETIIAQTDYYDFKTEFIGGFESEVLNKNSKWKWYSDNIFYNTFYFKCNNTLSTLPDLKFTVLNEDNTTYHKILEGQDINILPLIKSNLFSGVLAKSLKVKNSNVSHYDEQSNIVVLEIEATQANLQDFHIQNTLRSGIESYTNNFPQSHMYYFAIIEKERKTFSFTYFNLDKNSFEEIFVPIIIDNQNVSTQIDINPKKNRFELYKSIAIGLFSLFLFILYIIRKKKLYLLTSIITLIYVLFFRSTFNEVVIKENTNVKILPTKNSTIFHTTSKPTYAEKLLEKENYLKVMLPNNQIGWIKKERVEKN